MHAVLSCRASFVLESFSAFYIQHSVGNLGFSPVEFFSEGVSGESKPCVSPVVNSGVFSFLFDTFGSTIVHKGVSTYGSGRRWDSRGAARMGSRFLSIE